MLLINHVCISIPLPLHCKYLDVEKDILRLSDFVPTQRVVVHDIVTYFRSRIWYLPCHHNLHLDIPGL